MMVGTASQPPQPCLSRRLSSLHLLAYTLLSKRAYEMAVHYVNATACLWLQGRHDGDSMYSTVP